MHSLSRLSSRFVQSARVMTCLLSMLKVCCNEVTLTLVTLRYCKTVTICLLSPAAPFQEFAPAWIWIHAPLSIVAFIGGIVGVVFGGKLPEDGLDDTVYSTHKVSVAHFTSCMLATPHACCCKNDACCAAD